MMVVDKAGGGFATRNRMTISAWLDAVSMTSRLSVRLHFMFLFAECPNGNLWARFQLSIDYARAKERELRSKKSKLVTNCIRKEFCLNWNWSLNLKSWWDSEFETVRDMFSTKCFVETQLGHQAITLNEFPTHSTFSTHHAIRCNQCRQAMGDNHRRGEMWNCWSVASILREGKANNDNKTPTTKQTFRSECVKIKCQTSWCVTRRKESIERNNSEVMKWAVFDKVGKFYVFRKLSRNVSQQEPGTEGLQESKLSRTVPSSTSSTMLRMPEPSDGWNYAVSFDRYIIHHLWHFFLSKFRRKPFLRRKLFPHFSSPGNLRMNAKFYDEKSERASQRTLSKDAKNLICFVA